MDTKYNGWANYETRAVKLWMDNDEGTYGYWREAAEEAWDANEGDGTFTHAEAAAIDLAERLKAETEEGAPDLGASVWADFLSAAISEVNWHEIAVDLIEAGEFADEPEEVAVED